jgi:hypothetical protein
MTLFCAIMNIIYMSARDALFGQNLAGMQNKEKY